MELSFPRTFAPKSESTIGGTFAPWYFRSLGAKVLGNESSRERKFLGAKVPCNFRSRERKFQGAKVPPMVLSLPTWERKFQLPWTYPLQGCQFFSALNVKPKPFYCQTASKNAKNIAKVKSCSFRPLCSCSTFILRCLSGVSTFN